MTLKNRQMPQKQALLLISLTKTIQASLIFCTFAVISLKTTFIQVKLAYV